MIERTHKFLSVCNMALEVQKSTALSNVIKRFGVKGSLVETEEALHYSLYIYSDVYLVFTTKHFEVFSHSTPSKWTNSGL